MNPRTSSAQLRETLTTTARSLDSSLDELSHELSEWWRDLSILPRRSFVGTSWLSSSASSTRVVPAGMEASGDLESKAGAAQRVSVSDLWADIETTHGVAASQAPQSLLARVSRGAYSCDGEVGASPQPQRSSSASSEPAGFFTPTGQHRVSQHRVLRLRSHPSPATPGNGSTRAVRAARRQLLAEAAAEAAASAATDAAAAATAPADTASHGTGDAAAPACGAERAAERLQEQAAMVAASLMLTPEPKGPTPETKAEQRDWLMNQESRAAAADESPELVDGMAALKTPVSFAAVVGDNYAGARTRPRRRWRSARAAMSAMLSAVAIRRHRHLIPVDLDASSPPSRLANRLSSA